MFTRLKQFLNPFREPSYTWQSLVTGDYVRVFLKDPKKVGIISDTQTLTYQRLDSEDVQRGYVEGFVIRTEQLGNKPVVIETLELNVVKKTPHTQKLVTYLLLREEIEKMELIEDKHE